MIQPPHQLLPLISRILIAALIGSVIGWQRQLHGGAAGLRTHILVSIGASLLACVDVLNLPFQGKIVAAAVTGIGFLGAGTIIHSDKGDSVRGLTTAASVWVTAGIGLAVGIGGISTWLGAFVAILVFATLSVVYSIEDFALRQRRVRSLSIIIDRPEGQNVDDVTGRIIRHLTDSGVAVQGVIKESKSPSSSETPLRLQLRLPDGYDPALIMQACSTDKDVTQATWDI